MAGQSIVPLGSGRTLFRETHARALYSKPDLIIFDEATSALDTKNEKEIQQTILSLKNSVTLVVIAHRLGTVEGCDRIAWMDVGTVKMQGKTAEVLPAYRDFVKGKQHGDAAHHE